MTAADVPVGFRSGFVAIVGRPNVGKSTLLNRLVGEKIAITSDKPQTTRNRILGICNPPGAQVLFLDTPGIHAARDRFNRYMVDQAVQACTEVDAVLVLVEADQTPGPGDEAVFRILERGKAPVLLVINKIDRVPRPQLLPLIDTYARRYGFREILPVSALTGEGVDRIMPLILPWLPEGPRYYPEDQLTDLPERFIVAEMIREQVFHRTRQEIPYGTAVVVETFEEDDGRGLVRIQAVIHVSREGHKGILVGRQGTTIRAIGTAARKDIERFLGVKVFLELFVRVQRDWTNSPRLLREMGYE